MVSEKILNVHENRILFLKRFTAEIILSLYGEEIRKKKVEIAKLKQKLMLEQEPEKYISSGEVEQRRSLVYRANVPKDSQIKKRIYFPNASRRKGRQAHPRPILQSQNSSPRALHRPPTLSRQSPIPQRIKELTEVRPQAQSRPQGFSLGKIEHLLRDPSIESIECPGPGKNMTVKRFRKVNITKMLLAQEEISDIINHFSLQAKIPAIGGILKAAVGNLIISAVISEFVGSRFIITKIRPQIPRTS